MESWKIVLGIGAALTVVFFVALALSIGSLPSASSKVAVIPIEGVIAINSAGGAFSPISAGSTDIVNFIEQASKDESVDAILLRINSPGGSAVASDEIARAVASVDKPVAAWIRESGASGAYWAASQSDHIIANRMSITGSVGVIASYLNFNEFLTEYNVSYVDLKSGEYKDIGSPFDDIRSDERQILDDKLELIHQFFLDEVQQARGLSDDVMDEVDSGLFFLGAEAFELGLIDELGGEPEVDAYFKQILGSEPRYSVYEREFSFLESLAAAEVNFFPSMSLRSQLN